MPWLLAIHKGDEYLNGTRLSTATKFNTYFPGYGHFLPGGGLIEPVLLVYFWHLATLPASNCRYRFGRFHTRNISYMELL